HGRAEGPRARKKVRLSRASVGTDAPLQNCPPVARLHCPSSPRHPRAGESLPRRPDVRRRAPISLPARGAREKEPGERSLVRPCRGHCDVGVRPKSAAPVNCAKLEKPCLLPPKPSARTRL